MNSNTRCMEVIVSHTYIPEIIGDLFLFEYYSLLAQTNSIQGSLFPLSSKRREGRWNGE